MMENDTSNIVILFKMFISSRVNCECWICFSTDEGLR